MPPRLFALVLTKAARPPSAAGHGVALLAVERRRRRRPGTTPRPRWRAIDRSWHTGPAPAHGCLPPWTLDFPAPPAVETASLLHCYSEGAPVSVSGSFRRCWHFVCGALPGLPCPGQRIRSAAPAGQILQRRSPIAGGAGDSDRRCRSWYQRHFRELRRQAWFSFTPSMQSRRPIPASGTRLAPRYLRCQPPVPCEHPDFPA